MQLLRFWLLFCLLVSSFNCFAGTPPLNIAAPDAVAPLESLPVQSDGRIKPALSFAKEKLTAIYGRASFKLPDGTRIPALAVTLDLLARPEVWKKTEIVLVEEATLRAAVGLPAKRRYFSLEELAANEALQSLVQQAKIRRAAGTKISGVEQVSLQVDARLHLLTELLEGQLFRPVPNPHHPKKLWGTPADAASLYPGQGAEVTAAWEQFRLLVPSGDSTSLRTSASKFAQACSVLKPEFLPSQSVVFTEVFYNKSHPFRLAWIALLLASIVLMTTSLQQGGSGYKLGWWLACAGLGFVVVGMLARLYISGRPPVTNMYESVVWLAFGVMAFGLSYEWRYRCRWYLASACPLAALALILADSQPAILDASIKPLVPVLRSNFWLTVHVLTITLSYAAFALATAVAHAVLGSLCFLGKEPAAALHGYLYKVLQIGVLLLAIGIVLGGVWANYSWGRFWDWDPKETWSLVALLSYLFLLHGRLLGWWRGFGMAAGAILCFQTVLFAWYGVNFILATGLHSYGFGAGGTTYIAIYLGAETAFLVAAWIMKSKVSR